MGIFKFFKRKKEKSIDVPSIGTLKYAETKDGNVFFTYVENKEIKQNFELYIYTKAFAMPTEQIKCYNRIVGNWKLIEGDISARLKEDKKIAAEDISLNILGINEKGEDSYDAMLACSSGELNFTVSIKGLKVVDFEYLN